MNLRVLNEVGKERSCLLEPKISSSALSQTDEAEPSGFSLVLNKYFITGGDRTGHAHSGKMSLEMGFSVAGEHVGTLVQQFRELLKQGEHERKRIGRE